MDCTSSACLANVMQAATAALSWLVGRRDFFTEDVTEDSSSSSTSSSISTSSAGSPTAPKVCESKEGMPIVADGKRPSSSTLNMSADATDGSHPPKQGPAKSGKKKSDKNKKKGPESASTKAAGAEAAQPAEKERVEDNNMFIVAGKSRGGRGKKRTAADSSAPLSNKRTVQNGPELISGITHPCISWEFSTLELIQNISTLWIN